MAPAEDVTLGEVYRLVGDVRSDFQRLAGKVEERPDWQDIRRIENALLKDVADERAHREAALGTASRAIKALEDWNKWVLRTVGGAVMVSAVAWVLAGGLAF